MSALPYDPHRLADAAGSLITNCRELAHAGLTPATMAERIGLKLLETRQVGPDLRLLLERA